jgi:hypothetical protein
MDKYANFSATLELAEQKDLAFAGLPDEYKNPLLTWVKLVFADDKPNANKQGISKEEFPNLIKSMSYMPIKAKYAAESGLEGHAEASVIGVLKAGTVQEDKILAVGALYSDEFPDIVDFFKKSVAEGGRVDFSWEIRYKESAEKDGVEWLMNTTTKAITAVKNPAYEGRTHLVSMSVNQLIEEIDKEIAKREKVEVAK